MLDWIKYTLLQIKRNVNLWILITLIIIAVCLYKFFNVKLELIALIFSPLFTLSILPMIEESKAKCAELMATMASVLGLDKDMTFSDIASAYYPTGLANIDAIADKKANLEVQFYEKACCYIDNQLKDNPENKQ